MAGMRATARSGTPNPKAEALLRACMDLVEHLTGQSLNVTTAEVETTLGVLEQAYNEMDAEVGVTNPATVALKNAIGRLRSLRLEIEAK
jgi:hypothetical protein